MQERQIFEVEYSWVHVPYEETAQFVETYGFSGSQGVVNHRAQTVEFKNGIPFESLVRGGLEPRDHA
jgi:hypothetical protein